MLDESGIFPEGRPFSYLGRIFYVEFRAGNNGLACFIDEVGSAFG